MHKFRLVDAIRDEIAFIKRTCLRQLVDLHNSV